MSKAPEFSDTKELLYVRILDPEIYIPPGTCNLEAKGGLSPTHHRQGLRAGHMRAFTSGWEQ